MIEIKVLNRHELLQYVENEDFYTHKVISISKHRALSHAQNPRAEADDILMLMAYKENQLVGYLGVIPDRIYVHGVAEKCGVMSCIWIDPNFRGQKIVQQLLAKCFEVCNNRIIATEFTAVAKKVYDKSGLFSDLQINKGIRLYLRLDLHHILPAKKNIFKKSEWLLKTIDTSFNNIFDVRFWLVKSCLKNLNLEYINVIDSVTEKFIREKQSKQLFKRVGEELNWIIKNPWILSSPQKDMMSEKYEFSATDKSFNYYAIKVRNETNEMIAFLLFTKRNDILKLPYCYYEKNELKSVIEVINYHLIEWKISVFTTFHTEIVKYFKENKTLALYKKEAIRHYIISNELAKLTRNNTFEIQDGDGDCAFT